MTLAREPDGMRNFGGGVVVIAEQLQRTLDSLFRDKSVLGLSNGDLECLYKVMGFECCDCGEFDEPELVCQMGVDASM